jgi:hypothetical protein
MAESLALLHTKYAKPDNFENQRDGIGVTKHLQSPKCPRTDPLNPSSTGSVPEDLRLIVQGELRDVL